MTQKERLSWPSAQKHSNKRLLRNTAFLAAASICLGGCAFFAISQPQKTEAVMSHLTAGFEYDETLGRLQLVNNMLPESVMVFLNNDSAALDFYKPVDAQAIHAWSQQEPWLEYGCTGHVCACQAGEIVTIVQSHAGNHTMRILHEDGYESVYSGLQTIHVHEGDQVDAGQIIGTSAGTAAFELRKDGVSVLPAFSEL